ncbi:MAG: bifunctional riboflavin kinase/FAD synthetase [Planctomycetaceae bacterium]
MTGTNDGDEMTGTKLLRGFEGAADCRGGYVSIGNFDGVHRGHRRIIELLVRKARAADAPAVALTFDPHPIALLRPEHAPPNLTTTEHKAELLGRAGVDFVIAYPTDAALLELTPREFFECIVREKLAARGLVEGPNFFFGRDRTGNVETLRALCASAGMTLDIAEPFALEPEGRIVSSSAIRGLIAEGRMAEAVAALGHPYRVSGRIVPGAGRGRQLGFPTANLADIATLLPADGVYAGKAQVEGKPHPAAMHVGPNLTFDEAERKVECHLLDFSGALAGKLDVDLTARLRDTARFASGEELEAQLTADCEQARALAAG